MRLHLEHARPCERRQRPGRLLVRQRPQPQCPPHVQRHLRRNDAESLQPHQARHGQTRASERWNREDGCHAELRPPNEASTRSAQSAAHTATIRRSASLSVCGEPTPRVSQRSRSLPSARPRRRARLLWRHGDRPDEPSAPKRCENPPGSEVVQGSAAISSSARASSASTVSASSITRCTLARGITTAPLASA